MINLKNILVMTFALATFLVNSQENSKGIKLKVTDLGTIETGGKTYWTVKTTLTNKTRDTLYYFSYKGCESINYLPSSGVDSLQLVADMKECDPVQQLTVIRVPPSGQRILNLEIRPLKPMRSDFKLQIYLLTAKAKNINERVPNGDLKSVEKRHMLVVSNKIKVKIPKANDKQTG